ncbi:MAG TPA: PRC-barrel domain-containing protein [Planctomycetota bacterium]|nr:PRC-barrel domain-containing protein [Planctomycetota bacterium]
MQVRSTLPLILTVASSAAVLAQTDPPAAQERPAPATTASAYMLLKDALGAKVAFQPGAEAKREATADNKESARRPTGEIKEFLVETSTGKLEGAVVAFGGVLGLGDKTVALPASLMTWNPTDRRFDLAATEDQLKSLPAFDLNEARKRGLDTEIAVIRSGWANLDLAADHSKHANEASGTERKGGDVVRAIEGAARETARAGDPDADVQKAAQDATVAGTKFVKVQTRFVCASDLDDYPVYALNEKFGKVENCVLDQDKRQIAYCIVQHGGALGIGGTEYLVPFRALALCRDGDAQIWCIHRTTDQLKNDAVKYEKPKEGVLEPDVARRADEAFAEGR